METISKDALIQAQQGSVEAFERIYRAHADFVYNVSYRIANNAEDAKDITQDVFLKVHRNLKRFGFRSSLKTWIYRITVNTTINACKRRSRYLNRRAGYNDRIKHEELGKLAKDTIEEKNSRELLEHLFGALNPDQRACMALRDIEGLSYREIAETLNININTVRSRLKRARETLVALRQKGVI